MESDLQSGRWIGVPIAAIIAHVDVDNVAVDTLTRQGHQKSPRGKHHLLAVLTRLHLQMHHRYIGPLLLLSAHWQGYSARNRRLSRNNARDESSLGDKRFEFHAQIPAYVTEGVVCGIL